jgi:hypothetical protein
LAQDGRGAGINDGVHGGGEDGEVEANAGEFAAEVHILGIKGSGPRDECDVIEAKGLPRFPSATDCYLLHASTALLV